MDGPRGLPRGGGGRRPAKVCEILGLAGCDHLDLPTAPWTTTSTRPRRGSAGRSSPSVPSCSSSPRRWRSRATTAPPSPPSTACSLPVRDGHRGPRSPCAACASSSTRSTTPAIPICWWTSAPSASGWSGRWPPTPARRSGTPTGTPALGLRRFRTLSLPARASSWPRGTAASASRTSPPAARPSSIRHLGGLPEIARGPRGAADLGRSSAPATVRACWPRRWTSLAAGTYRRAEVVLVNDGGEPPAVPAGFPLPVVRVDLAAEPRPCRAPPKPASPPATGDFVAFLDDDDLAAPEHLATLAGLVCGGRGARRLHRRRGGPLRARRRGRAGSAASAASPTAATSIRDVLLVDNYIPFNTLLIERALFAAAGPFDPSLPFFEDWDFLIRLVGADAVPPPARRSPASTGTSAAAAITSSASDPASAPTSWRSRRGCSPSTPTASGPSRWRARSTPCAPSWSPSARGGPAPAATSPTCATIWPARASDLATLGRDHQELARERFLWEERYHAANGELAALREEREALRAEIQRLSGEIAAPLRRGREAPRRRGRPDGPPRPHLCRDRAPERDPPRDGGDPRLAGSPVAGTRQHSYDDPHRPPLQRADPPPDGGDRHPLPGVRAAAAGARGGGGPGLARGAGGDGGARRARRSRGPPLRARAAGGDPRRLRRRRGPGAARQRPRPRDARPAGGDRPLRSLADRELRLLRDAGARPLPQRPRHLGAPDVARRFLPLLVRGAADLLPRVPRRPRPRQPRADRRAIPTSRRSSRPVPFGVPDELPPHRPVLPAARGRRAPAPLRRPLRLVRPLDPARRPGDRSTARGLCC